jgi:hypothetical protein
MNLLSRMLGLCVLSALASCNSPVVLTALGPNSSEVTGQFGLFKARYEEAYQSQTIADSNAMLETGFALIHNNCLDYFRSEGKLQQRLNFFRDTTAVLAPLAAGALALSNKGTAAVGALTLATAANTGLINAVAQDFLFNADNIDVVSSYVVVALATHQAQVLSNKNSAPDAVTFNWAVQQLEDNQVICEPPHILSLVKQLIANGTVQPYNVGSSTGSTPTQKQIDDLLAALSKDLGGAVTATSDDAAALYWFLEMKADTKYYPAIASKLADLKDASPFDDKQNPVKGWQYQTAVKSELDKASVGIKAQLENVISTWATAPKTARLIPFQLQPAQSAPTLPLHVEVRVVPRGISNGQ